jgi:quinol monooxygenase YgiN
LIDVIASISVKPGCREKLLARFLANVPNVLAEDGCIHYYPTVDIDSGLPPQQKDENVVTVVEQWESLEHLHAHLKAPHQLAYREDVKDWVEGVSLKVLKKA